MIHVARLMPSIKAENAEIVKDYYNVQHVCMKSFSFINTPLLSPHLVFLTLSSTLSLPAPRFLLPVKS